MLLERVVAQGAWQTYRARPKEALHILNPRYSILIPVCNGMPYLKELIVSLLAIREKNVEFIFSDDNSEDGSFDYLQSFSDPRITLSQREKSMSMSEHWNWLLGEASGDWQMFVGQDDALQMGFFPLAERVTRKAEEIGVRAISTRRAYYFWPGTERYYGSQRVRYLGADTFSLQNSKTNLRRALKSQLEYFDLPQMYTSSLFKKSLLEEARIKLGTDVIRGHPQDAYLAALCCLIEDRYLRSEVPLGWVGSSQSSAGLATSLNLTEQVNLSDRHNSLAWRAQLYRSKIQGSELSYDAQAGDFSLAISSVYLWSAIRVLEPALNTKKSVLRENFFEKATIIYRGWFSLPPSLREPQRRVLLQDLAKLNGFQSPILRWLGLLFGFFWNVRRLVRKKFRLTLIAVLSITPASGFFSLIRTANQNPDITIQEASREVYEGFSAKVLLR